MLRYGMLVVAAATLLLQINNAQADAETWEIDAAHSSANFSVRHLMVSDVRGSFSDVLGTVSLDEKKLDQSKVEATVGIESLSSGNKKRDEHLKSPDFFDAKKFPRMAFSSTKITKKGKDKFKVDGNLTIHGVTKPAVLQISQLSKSVTNPFTGGLSRGLKAETTINRKDFGLVWNKALDAGGVAVGDEVSIVLDIELHQAAKPAAAADAAAKPAAPAVGKTAAAAAPVAAKPAAAPVAAKAPAAAPAKK